MRFNPGGVVRRAATTSAIALGAFALITATASATAGVATTTTLTSTPDSVLAGEIFTLTATVDNPAATGTVAFDTSNVALPGCAAVPVVNGIASCPVTAGNNFDYRSYRANYSGDSTFDPSNNSVWVGTYLRAVVTALATPNQVLALAPIVYKASVVGLNPGSVGDGSPATFDHGTVAFFVDDVPVPGCATQPVSNAGLATCPQAAPPVKGMHTLRTYFNGIVGVGPNSATAPFEVLAPVVTVADTDFGSVTAGGTATRTVKIGNDGNAPLTLSTLAVEGPFSIAGGTCADTTLEPGATCQLELLYAPTAAGTHTAALTITHNLGTTKAALTGTAVAVPAPPVAPTATPEPPKGGVLAPGAKPTFTVTIPSDSKAGTSSVPVLSLPLSCPATEECLLNGTLTINTSTLVGKTARASAATETVAKFSKVQVKAGGLKTIKLTISEAFIRSAQKQGIRRIKATLTINTQLGSGVRTTTRQQVTIVIPKAAKKKAARKVAQVQPRFTG